MLFFFNRGSFGDFGYLITSHFNFFCLQILLTGLWTNLFAMRFKFLSMIIFKILNFFFCKFILFFYITRRNPCFYNIINLILIIIYIFKSFISKIIHSFFHFFILITGLINFFGPNHNLFLFALKTLSNSFFKTLSTYSFFNLFRLGISRRL